MGFRDGGHPSGNGCGCLQLNNSIETGVMELRQGGRSAVTERQSEESRPSWKWNRSRKQEGWKALIKPLI